jgi:Rieske 2Fe-2S family protein
VEILQKRIGLPRDYYHDESVFEKEKELFFERMWLLAAREEDLRGVGDYVVREIAGESFFLVRGRDNKIRAYHNVCRHRGSQLLMEKGTVGSVIQCPYHAWSYDLDGKLVGVPEHHRFERLEKEKLGLFQLKVDVWDGFVFVNMNRESQSFQEVFSDFSKMWEHLNLGELRRASKLVYDVKANWKIIVENYSECYHCLPVHPKLNKITPFGGSSRTEYLSWAENRLFSGGFMVFADGYTSMTTSGTTKRSPIKGTRQEDLRRIYYYLLVPNMFFSLHPDYLMVHTLWPKNKDETRIECDFYFAEEEKAKPQFDPSDAVEVWDEINRQDWMVCEAAHKGTGSSFYQPGPMPENEDQVWNFDQFVHDALNSGQCQWTSSL